MLPIPGTKDSVIGSYVEFLKFESANGNHYQITVEVDVLAGAETLDLRLLTKNPDTGLWKVVENSPTYALPLSVGAHVFDFIAGVGVAVEGKQTNGAPHTFKWYVMKV